MTQITPTVSAAARERPAPPLAVRPGRAPWALIVAWTFAVGAAFLAIAAYHHTPGEDGPPGRLTPLARAMAPAEGPWRMVLAVHPRCPCTLATVANLQRLSRRVSGRLTVTALVYEPADGGDAGAWWDTSVVRGLRETPNVVVWRDPAGREAAGHGLYTSGGVVLYDASGAPRYQGGLTPSRGHEGDCAGTGAVTDRILGRAPSATTAPVFGCALGNAAARQTEAVP